MKHEVFPAGTICIHPYMFYTDRHYLHNSTHSHKSFTHTFFVFKGIFTDVHNFFLFLALIFTMCVESFHHGNKNRAQIIYPVLIILFM